jgi:cytoskeletal protein CcmA (bactofilin family)
MAMFSNNNNNNNNKEQQVKTTELSNSNTHIAKGAMFQGNVETYGTIRVEGKVFGNIKSKGKVSLGETSFVQGNLLSQNAEIAGEVSGVVEIVEILTLKTSAVIHGDIFCNKLIVESGATFNGKCQMGVVIKEITISDNFENPKNVQTNTTNAFSSQLASSSTVAETSKKPALKGKETEVNLPKNNLAQTDNKKEETNAK